MKNSKRSKVDPFIVMDVMESARKAEATGKHIIHMEIGQPGTPAPNIAKDLSLPFILARKPGKLPNETFVKDFDLEYGSTSIEIQKNTMVNENQLLETIKEAKKSEKERKFKQSLEMIMVFRDIDVKKGFTINEVIQLPNEMSTPAKICVIASGDMGIKAKSANADEILDNDGVTNLAQDKRKSRKLLNKYDFFLADTKLMPVVGKSLGQLMGPRGKMPTPVPFNADIQSFLDRFKKSIRVRLKNTLALSCKFGDENMSEDALAANANAIISAIEKKLPNGDKNLKKIMIKTTMGQTVKLEEGKK